VGDEDRGLAGLAVDLAQPAAQVLAHLVMSFVGETARLAAEVRQGRVWVDGRPVLDAEPGTSTGASAPSSWISATVPRPVRRHSRTVPGRAFSPWPTAAGGGGGAGFRAGVSHAPEPSPRCGGGWRTQ
jgi:hypothetical protein